MNKAGLRLKSLGLWAWLSVCVWCVLGMVSVLGGLPGLQAAVDAADSNSAATREPFVPKVDEYTVQPGDSLWSICEDVADDGTFWPKVWAFNPEITNPHWIYPGDLIRLYPSPQAFPNRVGLAQNRKSVARMARQTQAEDLSIVEDDEGYQAYDGPVVEVVRLHSKPKKRRRVAEQVQVPFLVTDAPLEDVGEVAGADDDKILLESADLMVLEFAEADRAVVGERYLLFRDLGWVKHPKQKRKRFHLTEVTGVVVVVGVDGAFVRVRPELVMAEIERKQRVAPLGQHPLRTILPQKTAKDLAGKILAVGNPKQNNAGSQEFVFIDIGKKEGVQAGHDFAIRDRADPMTRPGPGNIEMEIGKLLVVDVQEHSATCLVLRAEREIRPGQDIQASPKASDRL